MITIFPEPARKRLRVVMGDLLSVAEVEAFSRDKQAAVTAIGLRSGEFDLLVITEDNIVQTQPVMDAFAALMLHSPLKARKIATVRVSVLTRMQTRRISKVRDNAAVFDSVADAEAWLGASG